MKKTTKSHWAETDHATEIAMRVAKMGIEGARTENLRDEILVRMCKRMTSV
jgi:hypothetical protein